jgi:hypothetical protein
MAMVRRALERNEGSFTVALDLAQRRGEMRGDAETVVLARFLTASIQGLRRVGKAKRDRAALHDVKQAMRRCLDDKLMRGRGWEEAMLEPCHHGT